MSHSITHDVDLVVHSESSPSDAEWDAYLQHVNSYANRVKGTLVLTYGGVPTSPQRERGAKLRSGLSKRPPIAVMTDSQFSRAVVNVIARVFGEKIKAFPASSLGEACDFLMLSAQQREAVRVTLGSLKREIGRPG